MLIEARPITSLHINSHKDEAEVSLDAFVSFTEKLAHLQTVNQLFLDRYVPKFEQQNLSRTDFLLNKDTYISIIKEAETEFQEKNIFVRFIHSYILYSLGFGYALAIAKARKIVERTPYSSTQKNLTSYYPLSETKKTKVLKLFTDFIKDPSLIIDLQSLDDDWKISTKNSKSSVASITDFYKNVILINYYEGVLSRSEFNRIKDGYIALVDKVEKCARRQHIITHIFNKCILSWFGLDYFSYISNAKDPINRTPYTPKQLVEIAISKQQKLSTTKDFLAHFFDGLEKDFLDHYSVNPSDYDQFNLDAKRSSFKAIVIDGKSSYEYQDIHGIENDQHAEKRLEFIRQFTKNNKDLTLLFQTLFTQYLGNMVIGTIGYDISQILGPNEPSFYMVAQKSIVNQNNVPDLELEIIREENDTVKEVRASWSYSVDLKTTEKNPKTMESVATCKASFIVSLEKDYINCTNNLNQNYIVYSKPSFADLKIRYYANMPKIYDI